MTPNPGPIVPLYVYADPRTLDVADPAVFAALRAAVLRDRRRRDLAEVYVLLAAGWRFELPGGPDADPETMSWYWRSPPRREGGKGRLYLSTSRAFNALARQTPRG